jgi:hypothetical protein
VHKAKDADARAIDYPLLETPVVLRAGAPSVEDGGDAALFAYFISVNTPKGGAPINVNVDVDQSGSYQQSGCVDLSYCRAGELRFDGNDVPGANCNISNRVEAGCRVDDAASGDDKVEILLLGAQAGTVLPVK